jgi:hypothetical protein
VLVRAARSAAAAVLFLGIAAGMGYLIGRLD